MLFLNAERRGRQPMMPLGLFGDRTFSAANAMTLLVYAALGAVLFFLVLQLQTVGGYGALKAGLATLPLTVVMVFGASRGGALGQRIGPRIPMTVGPIVMGLSSLLFLMAGPDLNYWRDVLPGPDRLRHRPLADGGAADRDRAGGRPGREHRDRQRHQQRRRPRRLAAGRGGPAGGRGSRR